MTRFHSFAFRSLGFCAFALGIVLMMNRVADAADLVPTVHVEGTVITFADIIGTPPEAGGDIVVAQAPAPGERRVLSVQDIANRAYANDIAIANPNGLSRVVVERPGKPVPPATLRARIAGHLSGSGDHGDYRVEFAGRTPNIAVPADAPADVTVERLDYDRATGRFEARIAAGAGDGAVRRETIYGRISEVLDIPVLTRRAGKTDVIASSDVAWITVSRDRLSDDIVTDIAELVGKSPRRPLAAERAIRHRDLREPVIVSKGSAVTMVVTMPGMTLSALGRAMEDGSKGDVIRVVNADTHQTINAEVTAAGQVSARVQSGLLAIR